MKSLKFLSLVVMVALLILACNTTNGEGPGHEEGGGEGEESNQTLSLSDTYNNIRNGVRLILSYDSQNTSFAGTIENTTNKNICSVSVEVHLNNGTELGPTEPVDLAPSDKSNVSLSATGEKFTKWSAHPETSPCNSQTEETG